jgi:hypothetical protein
VSVALPVPEHVNVPATHERTRVTVAMVWRDTLVAFGTHSASILTGALLGFALIAILSSLLGALITLDMYARTSTILVSYGSNRNIPLAFQAVFGLLVGSFARGVIAWRVLHPDGNEVRTRGVLRAVLPYWLPLLLTAFIVGALLFVGNLGLNELLTELRIDLADVGQLSATPTGMVHSIILRTVSSLIPDPGAPFSEWLSYMRIEASRVSTLLVYAGGLSYFYVKNVQELPLSWVFGAGGLIVLFVVDVLQRFVVPAIVLSAGPGPLHLIGSVIRLAARHFVLVLVHTWLVRLAIFVVSTIFMTAPLVLTQSILVPLLIRTTGTAWPYLITTVLLAISIALVNMVLLAFSVVYDACLYRRLRAAA